MRAAFSGYGAGRGARSRAIALFAAVVDENAASGSVVGTLAAPGAGWTLRLADDAGGRFALDGGRIVVGATALDQASLPRPAILVAATDGTGATASRIEIEVQRPLPDLPLATGARVAAIGDSQIAYNNSGGPAIGAEKAAAAYAYGMIEQALALDPRFQFDSWYDTADPIGRNISGANQGIFGDHLDWQQPGFLGGILGRLPAVIARRPNVLVIEGGTNTLSSGDGSGRAGVDYAVNRLDLALRLSRAAGIPVVLQTIYPRGDWPAGDARHSQLAGVNAWIRAQAGRSGLLGICDPAELLAPGGILDPGLYFGDKVHLNQRGALLVARDHLLPILRQAVSAGSVFDQDPANANLLGTATAKMQGTGGAKAGATGSVATGFTVSVVRNASQVACSKEVVSSDTEAQVIDIVPADLVAAPYGQVDIALPLGTIGSPGAGKWYRLALKLETSGAEALAIPRLTAFLRTNGATTSHATAVAMQGFSGDFATPMPAGLSLWLRTKPFQAPAGVVCDRMGATLNLFFAKSAGAFRAKISNVLMREVADPRPAWGY